jgi:hypothetical protein
VDGSALLRSETELCRQLKLFSKKMTPDMWFRNTDLLGCIWRKGLGDPQDV